MNLAIDAIRYSDLCRGVAGVVEVLRADEQTTHHYASVYRQLRLQGTPIPTNDMWIAALVLQHGLTLCARDDHFDHLPQLLRV